MSKQLKTLQIPQENLTSQNSARKMAWRTQKRLKKLVSAFIAAIIFIGGFSGAVKVDASTTDYVNPVYDFPTTGGYFVFGTWSSAWNGYHLAIDLRRPADTPVYSILDGTVVSCGYYWGFGDANGPGGAAIIAHKNKYGDTFYALYGHLKDLEISPGQNVSRAHRIAKVMNFMNDYGQNTSHLHFGINTVRASYAGYTSEANADGFVDPYPYLQANCKEVSCSIIVGAGTGGIVIGGGMYQTGDFAMIQATANSGYQFDGWYENGVKIAGSTALYIFQVTSGRTLEARFIPKTALMMNNISISGSMKCRGKLTFTVNTSGGVSPYWYAFYIFKEGKICYISDHSLTNTFSYAPYTAGTYTVAAYCNDNEGQSVSKIQTITIT